MSNLGKSTSARGAAPVHSVLTVCDLSSAAMNATWRAAMVARDLRATLRILHPQPKAKVLPRTLCSLNELMESIGQCLNVATTAEAVNECVLRSATAAARQATVLVLPSHHGNPLRQWIMGTPAERLIRLCRAPVLVVKRPALSSYRRVLVPVELNPSANSLIALATALSRGSRLEILYAVGTADEMVPRELAASQSALRSCRQYRAQRSHLALHELITSVGAQACGAVTTVEFGDAPTVVMNKAQESRIELIVIGKRRLGLPADYLLGRTTQRVLANAQADVLILPASVGKAGSSAQQDGGCVRIDVGGCEHQSAYGSSGSV